MRKKAFVNTETCFDKILFLANSPVSEFVIGCVYASESLIGFFALKKPQF